MDIFEALRLSHDTQRAMAMQILDTATQDPKRGELFTEFKRELGAHAAAEERWFYLPLIEHDSTMGLARHGMGEHHEMDELVAELEKLETASTEWLEHFRKLQEKVFHHLDDEEEDFFPVAKQKLEQGQQSELAVGYEEDFAKFRIDKEPVSSAEDD
ncbi:hemerythrin domain-containing protein [Ramlibacter albus]|uniref:Hemerythrin domain-containing protein n=1 Tax=Ramlibacter albus TaxID=2079448 RepID=A0A923M7G0_9BURK|nr:hemerythrin domain-containing protein [Ramlibacter albus]MBC5764770.1 hemerythrin domain-containing protein [Ramlibacter albus]